jgi:orotate phosphoribosyltransferase
MSPNTGEHNPCDDQPPHGHPDTQPAQTSADLVNMLAARTGHFRLESGHHGSLWLDLDRLLLRPYALQPFARELAQRLSAHTIQAVCGPMTGGAFVAQFIAADLDVECYYAERTTHHERNGLYPVDYRLPDALRDEVRGKRIAVVDDAINAGSAVRGTLADLRACGATPVALGALLILGSRAADFASNMHLPLECIAALPNGSWAPDECPLCVSGLPLDDLAGS